MEKIIGIFDEQINYAERFKNYINTKKEIGCFAVVFGQEKELLDFLEKKKLSYLIVGEERLQQVENILEQVSYEIKIWVFTEELSTIVQKETYPRVFRYQKAKDILRQILLCEVENI